jgi:hypothetical protein
MKTPLVLAMLLLAAPAQATPVYFTTGIGASLFKYNDRALDNGIPRFTDLTYDFYAGIEWSPGFLERRGWWIDAGFRYQALGPSRYSEQTFFDGPRVGIKFRGRLTQ